MKRKASALGGSQLTSSDYVVSRRSKTARRVKYSRKGISAKKMIADFARHPFPAEWNTKITWDPPCATLVPGSTNGAAVIRLNSIYDPDYTNVFGNGQPLFFDEILSATGPYQKYRVNGWKCKLQILNHSPVQASGSPMPVDLYLMQGATDSLDVDTFSELQSSPGVQTHLLGHTSSGSAAYKTWYVNGRLKSFIPTTTATDDDFVGAYNGDPAKSVYLALGYSNATPTDSSYPKLFVKISIEFDVTLFSRDGAAS